MSDFLSHLTAEMRAAFEDLLNLTYWRDLAPDLHIAAAPTPKEDIAAEFAPEACHSVGVSLKTEGYFHLPPIAWRLPVATIAQAVQAVSAAGHLPVFAYMYDETWLLFMRLHRLLSAVLGEGYRMQPAFWAWHVDGAREPAGWRPHRDQDHTALRADRSPKSMTIWIPLTDATPLNGCMYVLPADRDAMYAASLARDIQLDLQDVRALPAAAGSVLGWTHALLHWGGRASDRAAAPRISVSVEFQRGDEPPGKTPLYDPLVLPPPALRLKLILRQLLQYQHLYRLAPDLKVLAEAVALRQVP